MKLTPIAAPSGNLSAHRHSQLLPKMSKEEMSELVADIEKNGLQQPIVLYKGEVLDGNHRYWACTAAKKPSSFVEFEGTDAEAQSFVVRANIHRRHLTPEQRRGIIATLLKADPTQSNRRIAETAKASHHTVEDVRAELETTGQVAQLEKTKGADGKSRKRKPGSKRRKSLAHETVSFFEVTNASTALNAYKTLQERLLDALGEVHEYTDLSQAEESARRTIEMIEEKLGQLQPEEADAA
jgi:hypothetical protein